MIHQSANRPNQILGGDRELVLIAILIAVSLAFSLAYLVGNRSERWRSGSARWRCLQRMGKADPLLRPVYLRHIRYRPFYPAKSGLLCQLRADTPRSWR